LVFDASTSGEISCRSSESFERIAPHVREFWLVSHISRYNERGMGRLLIILLAMATICGQTVRARELSIAAASDLVFCLEELNRAFNKSHREIVLKLITGASVNLFAQISNGAPFDVFLSADMRYPLELIKAGLASREPLTLYAIGHLVVWTASDAVDISSGIQSLAAPRIRKVAIAIPSTLLTVAPRRRLLPISMRGTPFKESWFLVKTSPKRHTSWRPAMLTPEVLPYPLSLLLALVPKVAGSKFRIMLIAARTGSRGDEEWCCEPRRSGLYRVPS
jgi:Bacterial extracellular solute-binding protein